MNRPINDTVSTMKAFSPDGFLPEPDKAPTTGDLFAA